MQKRIIIEEMTGEDLKFENIFNDIYNFDEKINTINKWLSELNNPKNSEDREELKHLLFRENNPEYGAISIYYDFDELSWFVQALPNGTIIPNTVILNRLPISLDFEEMSEEEFNNFINSLIHDMKNMDNWEFYNENGEKQIL